MISYVIHKVVKKTKHICLNFYERTNVPTINMVTCSISLNSKKHYGSASDSTLPLTIVYIPKNSFP